MTSSGRGSDRRGKLLLSLGSLLLALVFAELALRLFWTGPSLLKDPAHPFVLHPNPVYMPGVSGPAHFEPSPMGFRADPYPDGPAHRVIALGGSTTECLGLDSDETWPALLQVELRTALGEPVWVGNGGLSGIRMRHHIVQMENLLGRLPDLDAVVLLVGGNDFLRALRHTDPGEDWYEDPRERVRVHYEAFAVPARPDFGPFWERTELVHLLRRARQNLTWFRASVRTQEVADGRDYDAARRLRASRPVVEELPDLGPALVAYRRDLERTVELAERHGTRLVFATQPVMWEAGLPPALDSLLLLGEKDPARPPVGPGSYSPAALAQGMTRFNEELLAVCADRGLRCVDLASLLPSDTTVFYDDVHFNESGARKVATALAPALAERLGTGPR